MRIRDLAVMQLPALVREGLQSMMKVPSLNLQRASIMRRSSAPAPRLAAVNLAPTADQQGVGVEITALGRVTEEVEEAEHAVKVLLEVAQEHGSASPQRPIRLHLDLFGVGPPTSSRRVAFWACSFPASMRSCM